jgi:adenine-specific DNA-methyltransferase
MSTVPDTKIPLTSETPLKPRLEALKNLIPEAFTEDKIDFDKLKSALGNVAEIGQERYGLTWAGKSEAIRAVQIPSKGTLEPVPEESVNFDESQNLIIEGDNLEVLKLLQKSYYGKVKMIYIDPPYNTGNEFIYPDNFREGLEDYLLYSGQRADDGTRLSTSEEAAGRKHSRWLNMMYPRLFLARNLLHENGVIFVSIDDNEVKNLRALMDEVFGEESFVGGLTWESTTQPDNIGKARFRLQKKVEYILFYSKAPKANMQPFRLKQATTERKYPHVGQHGKCRFEIIERSFDGAYARPTMRFEILGQPPREGKQWQIGEETARELEAAGKVEVVDGIVKRAVYPEDELDDASFIPFWSHLTSSEYGTSQKGKATLNEIFGQPMGFDTVKPVELIKGITQYFDDDSLILDFFAGSGTTAQAVMELNEEDSGKRRFILVQLPEKTDRSHHLTIADITRERVRRVIAKLDKADEGKLELTNRPDRGFKAFRLTSSNFKVWDADNAPQDAAALEAQLDLFTENVTGETEQSVLFELVLKSGFPLTAKIERLELGGPVYAVEGKALYICLANPVTQETLEAVAEAKPERFVCLDVAFEGKDELKTNTVLQMRDAGIAFHTA